MPSNTLQGAATTRTIQELIWANIQDLPKESIQEVLTFIVFIRAKSFHPEMLASPERDLLRYELSVLDAQEKRHLELEFADYQALYPHE